MTTAHVDNEICAGHGNCTAICPEVFELDDDGYAKVIVDVVPVQLEAAVRTAADQCPERAISITDDAPGDDQRIPPLTKEQWGDAEYAAFGAMLGMPPAACRVLAPITNMTP